MATQGLGFPLNTMRLGACCNAVLSSLRAIHTRKFSQANAQAMPRLTLLGALQWTHHSSAQTTAAHSGGVIKHSNPRAVLASYKTSKEPADHGQRTHTHHQAVAWSKPSQHNHACVYSQTTLGRSQHHLTSIMYWPLTPNGWTSIDAPVMAHPCILSVQTTTPLDVQQCSARTRVAVRRCCGCTSATRCRPR